MITESTKNFISFILRYCRNYQRNMLLIPFQSTYSHYKGLLPHVDPSHRALLLDIPTQNTKKVCDSRQEHQIFYTILSSYSGYHFPYAFVRKKFIINKRQKEPHIYGRGREEGRIPSVYQKWTMTATVFFSISK